jgi:hypothetical protein
MNIIKERNEHPPNYYYSLAAILWLALSTVQEYCHVCFICKLQFTATRLVETTLKF